MGRYVGWNGLVGMLVLVGMTAPLRAATAVQRAQVLIIVPERRTGQDATAAQEHPQAPADAAPEAVAAPSAFRDPSQVRTTLFERRNGALRILLTEFTAL